MKNKKYCLIQRTPWISMLMWPTQHFSVPYPSLSSDRSIRTLRVPPQIRGVMEKSSPCARHSCYVYASYCLTGLDMWRVHMCFSPLYLWLMLVVRPGAANEGESRESHSVRKHLRRTRAKLLLREYEVRFVSSCMWSVQNKSLLLDKKNQYYDGGVMVQTWSEATGTSFL